MRFPGGEEKIKIYSAVCQLPVVVLEARVAQLGRDADKIWMDTTAVQPRHKRSCQELSLIHPSLIMGKSQSKLSQEQLADLQKNTYCPS